MASCATSCEWYQPSALADEPASEDGDRITVEVVAGVNDAEIGQLLFDKGLISSQLAFQLAVLEAGREGDLQAGVYDLSPALRPSEIVAALRQEAGEEVTVTIIEGWRLEADRRLPGHHQADDEPGGVRGAGQGAAARPDRASYDFLADLPAGRSLEGYLVPTRTGSTLNATARQVLEKLLGAFGNGLTAGDARPDRRQGLTLDQAVNLASIVEREAVLDEERPLIAGVYLNRLNHPNAGTVGLLNADPTLQYGLATAEFGMQPVADWGAIEWWPQLPDWRAASAAARRAGRLPDLPGQGAAAVADRLAARSVRCRRRGPSGYGQRLLLLRGRLSRRRARRLALLRGDAAASTTPTSPRPTPSARRDLLVAHPRADHRFPGEAVCRDHEPEWRVYPWQPH